MLLAPTTGLLYDAQITIINMSAEIFSQQSFELKMVRQNQKHATGCTILLDQNIARPITGSWYKKNYVAFVAFQRDLPKGMKVGIALFAAF